VYSAYPSGYAPYTNRWQPLSKTMKLLLILILTIYAPITTIACSCDWLGDFFEATKKSNPDLIVKAKIISKITDDDGFQMKMKVEIVKTLKGQSSTNTISIWGDQGADCRPYISGFEIGDVYYFAIHEYENEYELINCGEHFLKVVDDFVESDMKVREGLHQIGKLEERKFIEQLKN